MTGARAPAWRPILSGDEATAARRAVAEVAAALEPGAAALASGDSALGYDLADGAAGVALLFGYLARITGSPHHRATAAALLDGAADRLAAAPTSPSLFHGFAGVAWAADHVRALLGDADLAINDEIDVAVSAALGSPDALGTADAAPGSADAALLSTGTARGFDLITGMVGLGVYALERAGRPAADRCVDRVVEALAATARRVPDGLVWTAPDRPDRLDLGLAHGIPGVIALLARCAGAGGHAAGREAATLGHGGEAAGRSTAATAHRLLDGAVPWLLAQQRSGGGFPPCLVGGEPATRGRAGWCYGDAAIALALVQASRIGRPAWFDAGLEIARAAAARPPCETGVRDAGLCHGAAALGLIYQRLYHATGDPVLRAAAHDWVLRTLEYRSDRAELAPAAGFFRATTGAPRAAAGLMNGAAGIALILLAASSDVPPAWDRALLLSGEPVPP